MTETFYANLGRVRKDRYTDGVVKVGTIQEVSRFNGHENGYNGKPGILLRVAHAGQIFDYPLIGHEHSGRFLDEFHDDTKSDLVGKVVEILGEGHTITPEIGDDYPILTDNIFGVRPRH